MRSLTGPAQAKIANRFGNESVCIVRVAWDGVNYHDYTDKDYAGISGRILEMGNIDDVRNLSGTSSSAQVSITLDDTDQHIRRFINHFDVHKIPVIIRQSFADLSISDSFIIFRGKLVTPLVWSEGEQKVSFEATSYIESMEVGFSPEEAQFSNVSPKLINKVWPLAFGDCVHIPAVASWERVTGTNVTGIGVPDYTLPYKYWHLVERITILAAGYEYYFLCVNFLRQLIGTAPVDYDSLLKLPRNISDDLLNQAPALDKPDTSINVTNLKGEISYLDRITIPQLYQGLRPNQKDDAYKAVDVINQIETSYAEIILTEQQYKQDHEDLASMVHLLGKGVDKLQALMDEAPSPSRYLAVLDGLVKFFQKEVDDHEKPIDKLVEQEIRIPTEQTDLFKLNPKDPPKISDAVQGAIDKLKESITAIKELRDKVAASQDRTDWVKNTETTKKAISDSLDQQKLMVKSYGDALEKIGGAKERIKIDMENAEYAYKTIEEVDKKIDKLILDYHKTLKELWKVQRAIIEQGSMEKRIIVLSSNNTFPNGRTLLQVKDMVFLGTISGNLFTVEQVVPKYQNIAIGPRETNEVDCFWITDPTIILKGCYCLKTFIIGTDDPDYDPNHPQDRTRNRIFHVKEQYGTKCVIEMIENKERQAPKKQSDQSATLQKLPDFFEKEIFKDGHAHTRHEIIRILENSLEKYEKERLQQIKTLVEKLADLATEAPDDDRRAATNEAITKNVNEYNARVNKLRFKKEAVDKCNEKITDGETSDLLKLENLKLVILTDGVDNTPTRIAPATRLYYITGFDITGTISGASQAMLPSWFQYSPGGQELADNQTILAIPGTNQIIKANYLPDSSFWYATPGSEVSIANDTAVKYIANILPSQVVAVYGKTAVGGAVQLTPLPATLYVINENDRSYQNSAIPDPEFTPMAVTSVTLRQPLSAYNLGFHDDVYVSLKSSVGPNTADIIQWIVETWTDLSVDAGSFANVASRLVNYPQNFALFNKQDALKLIEQIAWENRCAVYVKNNVVYLQYMAEDQTPIDTITESDVDEGSLSYELTSTEDIATKLIGKWKPDYALSGDDEIVVRYNIRKYGLHTKSFTFETFNIYDLVYKSITFWSIRYANSWKRVKFKTPLHKLAIETFDWITLDFQQQYFSDGPIDALVEKADYDSASQTVSIQCWVPIRSGELTKYDFAIPADLSATVIYPPAEDIVLGLAGNYQNSQTPTNIPFKINANINLVDAIELRPKDYGDPFPGDTANVLPPSPLQGLVLQNYLFNPQATLNYNTPDYPKVETTNSGKPKIGYAEGARGDPGELGEKAGNNNVTDSGTPPLRESFSARIASLYDRDTDEYVVVASDNKQYQAVCLTPSLGSLKTGDPVMIVRDSILKRYVIINTRVSVPALEYYVVREEKLDYLLCAKFNYKGSAESPTKDTVHGTAESTQATTPPIPETPPAETNPVQLYDKDLEKTGGTVSIAKPRVLQSTPFDGKTVEYPDVKVTYVYDPANIGRRKAQVYDQSQPEDTEKITPPYYVGDIITVRKGSTGLLDDSNKEIVLVDVNEAGRAWAKVIENAGS